MVDKFIMIIHKITHSVDYNYWLKRLDNQLNEATNQNSIKVPKVKQNVSIKLWGQVNSPLSPPSPH